LESYFTLPFVIAFIYFVLVIYSQLAERAGIPPGVINVVTSSREKTPAVGKVICEHPLVAKISFTGSTAVGKVGISLGD
jgi:succinate-semialdehyde dehydrogenase